MKKNYSRDPTWTSFPVFFNTYADMLLSTRRSALEVADLCAAISSGIVHFIFLHLQRIPNSARCRGHIVNTSWDTCTSKIPKKNILKFDPNTFLTHLIGKEL